MVDTQEGRSPAGTAGASGQVGTSGESRVYLVGAGPGDAGLITARGRDLLRRADVVVHDYLANPELLQWAKPGVRLVDVGKKGFAPHITQGELNALLVDEVRGLEARGGGILVRLKGGDPFVFGRGGEEALALSRAGIPFEVVPGVTSGVAAPAYAGIPVTHRGISSSVTFITGHEDPEKETSSIDWKALALLAQAGGTLCFYMGMRNLPLIADHLVQEGAAPDTPVALVRWGTMSTQQTLVASLSDVAESARERGFGAPAIILVGQVAGLRGQMAWFESRPLFGLTVAVTRSRSQVSGFSAQLRELGASVLEVPTIAFTEPDDQMPLDAAIAELGTYDWAVFTSVNGVDAFFGRLALRGRQTECATAFPDARALAGVRVAAIGPATVQRLREKGVQADAVPAEYRGEAVFDAIVDASERLRMPLEGARVLIARAQEARPELPDLLRQAGARVDVVAAYKTVPPEDEGAGRLADLLEEGRVDAVTFTSSSTVRNLVALLGDRACSLHKARLFSIGPITSQTLRRAGFDDAVEALDYTIPGLVQAMVRAYSREEQGERV